MSALDRAYQIVKKPVVSEKATYDLENNTYHLRVPVTANKVEIRQAVEVLFGVKVARVNTLHAPRKFRRRGYQSGQTPAWKRAMVTLHEGHTIEIL